MARLLVARILITTLSVTRQQMIDGHRLYVTDLLETLVSNYAIRDKGLGDLRCRQLSRG